MPRRPTTAYSAFVEHPRFGKGPRVTGLDPVESSDGTVFLHWHSGPGARIAGTAVVADLARQVPATVPVTHYFDVKRVCRACQRPFLFFAEEQRHWYETLRFPLEADCLDCVPCRKDEQHLRALRQKYDTLLAVREREDPDTLALIECAVELMESAVFTVKLVPRLRGLLKPIASRSDAPLQARAADIHSRLAQLERR